MATQDAFEVELKRIDETIETNWMKISLAQRYRKFEYSTLLSYKSFWVLEVSQNSSRERRLEPWKCRKLKPVF